MKIFLLLQFLTFSYLIHSQNLEGQILYKKQVIVNLDSFRAKLDENSFFTEEMKTRMIEGLKKSDKSELKELLFTKDKVLFQNSKMDEVKSEIVDYGSFRYEKSAWVANESYFGDLVSRTFTQRKEYQSKTFLIKGAIEKKPWKITGNQRKIGDFECFEAIFTDSTGTTTAFFTPGIQVSAGPDEYGGLPGMILDLSIPKGNDQILFTLDTVILKSIDPELLITPKKGKKISEEDYNKMVSDRIKESSKSNKKTRVIIR
jgi:GLPGLI family protein